MTVRHALAIVITLLLAACASAPQDRTPPARAEIPPAAANAAAAHALKMVGKRYRMGGASAARGFDCSGLVQFSYRQAGIAVPRSTEVQLSASVPVPRSRLRRGDLLFFNQEGKKNSHVGIYLGEGRFVHAPSSSKRVRVDLVDSRYWRAHLSSTRRF